MADFPFDPGRVLVLVGPTSAGKSRLAMELSEHFPLELVCMDSMQIYAELQVGTSRPDRSETERVPHHLFGAVSVREQMTCMAYVAAAGAHMAAIQARGAIPLLVGGTGLYMRALFEGLANLPPTPPPLRERLNATAQRKGRAWLYRLLKRLDPGGAASLHANDKQRIQRFLEVRILTGKSMLALWEAGRRPDRPLPVGIGLELERAVLHRRIKTRIMEMLDSGWPAECRYLMERGLVGEVLRVGPLGYAQIFDYLSGKKSYDEMVQDIFVATRRYAKRQMTWFRRSPYIQWFPFDAESGYNTSSIFSFVKKKLG